MLDRSLRITKERIFEPGAASLAKVVGPTTLTAASLGTALVCAALAATNHPWWAVAAWWASRLLDGFDGPVARARGQVSDLGGYLDMVGDTIGYAVIPLGVAAGVDSRGAWIAAAALVASFFVNAISWTYLAAVLEKHGHGAAATGEMTTITMPPALVEGTETIVLFSVFIALPDAAMPTFWAMAALVTVNVVQRISWAARHLTDTSRRHP